MMKKNLFENTVDKIELNRQRFKEGKLNCIPFTNFSRLSTMLPGLIQGTGWIVTANSGIGKSQFTKSAFVIEPLEFILDNPDCGLDVKVNYFALEESQQEFMCSMICYKLKKDFKMTVDPLDLLTMFNKETVPDDLMDKIKSLQEYFEWFLSKVNIIDSISNPYGIYKYIRQYSRDNGTHYYYNFITDKAKKFPITENDWKERESKKQLTGKSTEEYIQMNAKDNFAYSHYEPNNPDEYVICIVDHFSLLQPEVDFNTGQQMSLHQAMTKMSADYGRKQITKHYNYIFVNVQQQMGTQEELAFTNTGMKIVEKLKPTLAGLADNKLTARDAHVVLGIFAPNRYGIEEYNGYNIDKLDDNYRSLLVMKNRIGKGNLEVPLFFNGAVNQFRELPREMKQEDYEKVAQAIKKTTHGN